MNAMAFKQLCVAINPFLPIARKGSREIEEQLTDVWRLAEFHTVRPAFATTLDRVGVGLDGLPDAKAFLRDNQINALQATREIARLSTELKSEGIDHLFMKGAMLGAQVFGGPEKREYNDIDLLVEPTVRNRAIAILARCDYEPVVGDPIMRRTFFDYMGQHIFKNGENGFVVDLHWSLVGNRPFPIDTRAILQSREEFEIAGSSIPVPCIADLALLLAGHGQKEGWASFQWVLDFAAFAACYPHFDWPRALERSEERRCSRPLLTVILLAKRHFGAVIDAAILAKAEKNQAICEDVEEIWQKHADRCVRQHSDDIHALTRLCETRGQRAQVYWNVLTNRTIGDYEAMPLPRPLWWVYHLTRPLRLCWNNLAGREAKPSEFWVSKLKESRQKR